MFSALPYGRNASVRAKPLVGFGLVVLVKFAAAFVVVGLLRRAAVRRARYAGTGSPAARYWLARAVAAMMPDCALCARVISVIRVNSVMMR